MKREQIISQYIDAVDRILVAFRFNQVPNHEDIGIVTLHVKKFTNALRELYLSDDEDKENKYMMIFDTISKAYIDIARENFQVDPSGTYWEQIISSLDMVHAHISELYFQTTENFYPKPKQRKLPSHLPEIKVEEETPLFKNNFDNVKPNEIFKHFKTGLVDKGYLTEKELNEFLKAAFEIKSTPETLFKIKNARKKSDIEAVFYNYYKNLSGKIHGTQKKYAALLGDYFEGYNTSSVSSNFNKSVTNFTKPLLGLLIFF